MISDKTSIRQLIAIMLQHDVRDVILSPGSRNAPIINTFCQTPGFNCLSIVDERSAAFFALGMAQWKQKPVAICCTSGTAVLNYAPAIAEAYYQKIPLIVITADRPERWIDQADGQTIRQSGIYNSYIKKSFNLPESFSSEEDTWYCNRIINEAINLSRYPEAGPVHINVPLSEPLYQQENTTLPKVRTINFIRNNQFPDESSMNTLINAWENASKKMIIVGQLPPDSQINKFIEKLATDPSVTILTETTSNITVKQVHSSIDNIVFTLTNEEQKDFSPDILLTFGGQIVSKRIKAFLRANPPREHWFISPSGAHTDTFRCLTTLIESFPVNILQKLSTAKQKTASYSYNHLWTERDTKTRANATEYITQAEHSDLVIFSKVFSHIPQGTVLHTANSTPVRYAQLLPRPEEIVCFANRGTSGIDGCVSTAAGSAFASKRPTVLITGDLSFFYDSNALWNSYLTSDFKIILINNGGGGIFRIINGPSTLPALDNYIEAVHNHSARQLAETFGVRYLSAKNSEEADTAIEKFFREKGPILLEVFTPGKQNPAILKDYFIYLKNEIHKKN